MTEDPRLTPIVADYSGEMLRFTDWLLASFVNANLAHIEELASLHERLGPANALFREPRV